MMRPAGPTAGPGAGGWRTATRSLTHREFRWLFASNIAFFFAMNGQMIVRSVLTFDLTGSAFSLGLVNLAVAVPMLIVSPFGGVFSDRLERKFVIVTGQSVLLVTEVVIFGLLVADLLQFWHLMVAAFLMGCVFPFVMPARQAIVANIVGRDGMQNAMALQMSGMNASRVIAPVLAGFLIFLIGLAGAYAVSLALYVVAFLAILQIRTSPAPPRLVERSVMGDMAYGAKYVWDDRPVRALMLLSILPILLAMPFQAMLVVFAEEVWDVGSAGLGTLQAAAGVGGLLGSLYVAWQGDTDRRLRLLMFSLFAFGMALLGFALSPWFLLAIPLVVVADVFASVFTTSNGTAIQILIPDEVRGRVMSIMMMTFGLTPLGTVPVSAMADAWGAPVAVGIACIVMMVLAAAFFAFSKSLRTIDDSCREAVRAGPPSVPVGFPGAAAPDGHLPAGVATGGS